MSTVLKLDGILIVGAPNLAALHNRVLLLFGGQPTVLKLGLAHVRGLTWAGFRNFLRAVPPGLRGRWEDGGELLSVPASGSAGFSESASGNGLGLGGSPQEAA